MGYRLEQEHKHSSSMPVCCLSLHSDNQKSSYSYMRSIPSLNIIYYKECHVTKCRISLSIVSNKNLIKNQHPELVRASYCRKIIYTVNGLASCHVNWSLTNSFFNQTGHLHKSLSSFYTMKILYTFLNDVSYYKVVF